MRGLWIVVLSSLLLAGCATTPAEPVEVTREVSVTQLVEVTRPVVIEVEVTRLVVVTATPGPTDTPAEPTVTVESLATTLAATTPEGSGSAACWPWQEAASHLGEVGCVEGTVASVGQSDSASFINFSEERGTFYLVSFDWMWEELAGECIRVEGTISEFRGRAQIIVDEPTQMRYCDSSDSPPAFRR